MRPRHEETRDSSHWHPLCRLLGVLASVFILMALALTASASVFADGSMPLLLAAGLVSAAALCLLAASITTHKGQKRATVTLLIAGLSGIAAFFFLFSPGGAAFIAFLPVLVVAVALPSLHHARTLVWVMIGAASGGALFLIADAFWVPPLQLPLGIDLAFRAVGYAALFALASALFYRHTRKTLTTLQRTRTEKQALRLLSRHLEESNRSLQATQKRLEETNHSLRASQEQLRKGNRATMRFLNSAAHELRTPMTPIFLHVDMMRRTPTTQKHPRLQTSLAVIERNMQRLKNHLDDLVDAAQLRAEQYSFRVENTPLDILFSEIRDTFEGIAKEKGVRLEAESPRIRVLADEDRIVQVLTTLVMNALEATPAGGRILITARPDNGSCTIQVADTGKGLTPEERGRIFDPFTPLGDRQAIGKSGLGLYLCRSIVEGHGGEIRCMSPGPGKGTVFRFTLPLAPKGRAATKTPPDDTKTPTTPPDQRALYPSSPGRT
jgi:signal transduction histidine kinase